MIRVFRISCAEHLANGKDGADKVDSWRNVSTDVAVEDGDAEAAIAKLKTLPPAEVPAELVVERRILGISLVTEAL